MKNLPQKEKPLRRGTQRQKKVAKLAIDNLTLDKPLNGGEIVANSGYGPSMSKNPQVILESEGVKTEMAILGFDERNAKSVVGSILNKESAQDKDRLKAADMVFEVFGTKAPLKSLTVQFHIENKEQVEDIASKVLEQMRNDEIV